MRLLFLHCAGYPPQYGSDASYQQAAQQAAAAGEAAAAAVSAAAAATGAAAAAAAHEASTASRPQAKPTAVTRAPDVSAESAPAGGRGQDATEAADSAAAVGHL